MKNKEQELKEEIEKRAKIDFNKALCQDNYTNADDVFEKSLLDLLQRAERKQYTPNFLAIQGCIYWRCIIQYFRKLYDKEILQAELKGYQKAKQEFIDKIDWKIKDLKRRKPKLFAETSKYAMQMSIEELEELEKSLNSQETKSSNVLAEYSSGSSPDKSLGGEELK